MICEREIGNIVQGKRIDSPIYTEGRGGSSMRCMVVCQLSSGEVLNRVSITQQSHALPHELQATNYTVHTVQPL